MPAPQSSAASPPAFNSCPAETHVLHGRLVKADPSQLRVAIYEFARARLETDTSWADEIERKQLSAALETAIQGLKNFRYAKTSRNAFNFPLHPCSLGSRPGQPKQFPCPSLAIHRSSSASGEFPAYWRTEELPIVEVHTRARLSRFAWFWIGISLSAALAVSAIYTQRSVYIAGGEEFSFRIGGPKFGNSANADPAAIIGGGWCEYSRHFGDITAISAAAP
jgi:hypothetical protein